MIPKHIFFTYKNNDVPKIVFKRWKDLNENYTIYFYNDNDCFNFINQYFGIDYANYFKDINIGPYKADFWRLCVLYIHGGIYSDIDLVPIMSIKDMIKDSNLCTCLAMNGKSIFQAFIATTPRNELIKLCLNSFYNKKNDKTFLQNLKDCSPTYDMFNVFCNYLKKNKIKANKDYYKNNQKIRILKEEGNDYLNAFVSFKNIKLFNSRDIDYVNHNLHKIPWTNQSQFPKGNYIQTSKDLKIENELFYLKCYSIDNNLIPNKIIIKNDCNYENINGFLYDNINNYKINIIPKNIYQSYPCNIKKNNHFNYYIYNEEEKDIFMKNNYENIHELYSNLYYILKNYLWSVCVIYKNGGIYYDNIIVNHFNVNDLIENSFFISNIDKTKNINFHCFSSVKNSPLLKCIIDEFVNYFYNNKVIELEKIINIGKSDEFIKIIKIPGICNCKTTPEIYEIDVCKYSFETIIDVDKELLYIIRNDQQIGWKKDLFFKCKIKNYSNILNSGIEKYLLNNNLPVLNDDNKENYKNYKKSILNIKDDIYSESL